MAYPGPQTTHSDALAGNAFVKALSDDPKLCLKVRELDPKDLDEAVRHAKLFEAYRLAAKSDRRHNDVRWVRESFQAHAVTEGGSTERQ